MSYYGDKSICGSKRTANWFWWITKRMRSNRGIRPPAPALERMTGRPPAHAYVYFLRPEVAVPVSLERTLLDDPEVLVREFREAQSTVKFPLREGDHCTRCPYFRGLCPAGFRNGSDAAVD